MDFFMSNLSLLAGNLLFIVIFHTRFLSKPYINVSCKGYHLCLLFSRPSSKKLSQAVVDGVSVLGSQYHGMLSFCSSGLMSGFCVNVTLLHRPEAVAEMPFPLLLVTLFFQKSCTALIQRSSSFLSRT